MRPFPSLWRIGEHRGVPPRPRDAEETDIDPEKMEREVVKAAVDLVQRYPDIGAFVFECSDIPPFARATSEATGLPVFDFITLAHLVYGRRCREGMRDSCDLVFVRWAHKNQTGGAKNFGKGVMRSNRLRAYAVPHRRVRGGTHPNGRRRSVT